MNPELDKKLCEAFPILYQDREAPMQSTCMCWGFPGDGWFQIIWDLSEKLEALLGKLPKDMCYCGHNRTSHSIPRDCPSLPQYRREGESYESLTCEQCNCHKFCDHRPKAVQVKEKFASLRFYMSAETDEMSVLIRAAEKLSVITCEDCGKKGKIRNDIGWYLTLCTKCWKKHKEARCKK